MPIVEYGESHISTSSILELIDPDEYDVLPAAAKDKFRIIISCGFVNMNPNHPIRDWLFALFPSGNSYNALRARFYQEVE